MTTINAEVVADSKNPWGDRITSLLITFPRFILAEVNTHRMLSKNTSSSRAIPFNKMLEKVQTDPFIPIAWQKHHPGMQGFDYLIDDHDVEVAKLTWLTGRDYAVDAAKDLYTCGVTKQLANRQLEPYMWTTMLITGTNDGWNNFFNLRCPSYELETPVTKTKKVFRSRKDVIKSRSAFWDLDGRKNFDSYSEIDWLKLNTGQAEIHMMTLAECIYDAIQESVPKELKEGNWHVPFGNKIPEVYWKSLTGEYDTKFPIPEMVKSSTSMAARTSYTVVGDEKEVEWTKHFELHDRLVNQKPPHSSPMEHCAQVPTNEEYGSYIKGKCSFIDIPDMDTFLSLDTNSMGWFRNFKGFKPYRQIIEENL